MAKKKLFKKQKKMLGKLGKDVASPVKKQVKKHTKVARDIVSGKGDKLRNVAILSGVGAAIIVGGNWLKKQLRR